MHILNYLEKTPGYGIFYKNHGHCRIKGFSNAYWAGCPMDRKSIFGYLLEKTLCHEVSHSSAKYGYQAMAHATFELI